MFLFKITCFIGAIVLIAANPLQQMLSSGGSVQFMPVLLHPGPHPSTFGQHPIYLVHTLPSDAARSINHPSDTPSTPEDRHEHEQRIIREAISKAHNGDSNGTQTSIVQINKSVPVTKSIEAELSPKVDAAAGDTDVSNIKHLRETIEDLREQLQASKNPAAPASSQTPASPKKEPTNTPLEVGTKVNAAPASVTIQPQAVDHPSTENAVSAPVITHASLVKAVENMKPTAQLKFFRKMVHNLHTKLKDSKQTATEGDVDAEAQSKKTHVITEHLSQEDDVTHAPKKDDVNHALKKDDANHVPKKDDVAEHSTLAKPTVNGMYKMFNKKLEFKLIKKNNLHKILQLTNRNRNQDYLLR